MSTFAFGGTNLKKGASGDTVKRIQEALNNHGYGLGVDGIWGDKTDTAIRDYQTKNGLTVDGIYGVNTHNSLFGIAPSEPKEPKSYSDIDMSKYDSGYQKSDDVIKAETNKTNAENAVNSFGDFAYSDQATFDDIMNKILNREKFSYDLNGDALYQQYKDKYIQQGKMAMQDAMGQASALTGGYGNSYAATVGNQAYQASLENLNDIVPELYQLAYDKYNQEGQDMLNKYSMLSDDRNAEYAMWGDKYNKLVADRDYYGNEANNAYARDYGEWSDSYNRDFNQYWTETNFGYQKDRDAVADEQWKASFDEGVRQFNASMAEQQRQHNETLSHNKNVSNKNYVAGGGWDNGDVSTADIKAMQEALGLKADGKWGSGSMQAAGGLSADEAYEAWVNGELGGYEYSESQATNDFISGVATRSEFGSRNGLDYNGKHYTKYEDYIDAKLRDYANSGKLTESEVASLIKYFGL